MQPLQVAVALVAIYHHIINKLRFGSYTNGIDRKQYHNFIIEERSAEMDRHYVG